MTFTPATTVAELAAADPATIAVFQKHGIDFCCGGTRALEAVCAERALSYDALAVELTSARALAPPRVTWDARPLRELTAHIVESFHDPLSVELPRLLAMARRVEERHGTGSQPGAHAIVAALETFTDAMTPHTRLEETEIFPLIERLDDGAARPGDTERFIAAQAELETEHHNAARLLAALRAATGGDYTAPAGSCPTTLGLYYGLGELEALMTLHVHLENNVLFPRAHALALPPRQGV